MRDDAGGRWLSWWLFPKLDLHFGVLHWLDEGA